MQIQGSKNDTNQIQLQSNQQIYSQTQLLQDEQEAPTNEFIDDEEDDIDEMSSSNYSYQNFQKEGAFSQHSTKQPHNHNQFPNQYTDHRKMNNKIMSIEKTSNNLSTQYQVSNVQQVNQSQSLIQPNNSSITRKLPQNISTHQQSKANQNSQMKLPMGSSEMYNAFQNKNESIISNNIGRNVVNQSNSQMQDAHTPINMSTGRSRIEMIQSQAQSSKTTDRKLEQPSFQEQPRFQGKTFFQPHQQQNYRDMDDDQDEEDYHNMTEQDLDGHDVQEEDDDHEADIDAQDQDIQDYQGDDDNEEEEKESQNNDQQEEEQYDTANEDNNNNDGDDDEDNDDDQITDSLQSQSSPDVRPSQPNQIQNPNQLDYFTNTQNDDMSVIRPSYQLRSSSQTDINQSNSSTLQGGYDQPFFNVQNCNNAVVERNERFLVLKMVPQQTGVKDQPTPLLGDRNLQSHNNKVYRETVEDINSSDNSDQKQKQDSFFNYKEVEESQKIQQDSLMSSPNQQYGKTQVMDHSLIEETRIDYNQIRSMKNQIVNQQSNNQMNIQMMLQKTNQHEISESIHSLKHQQTTKSNQQQNAQQIAKEAKLYKQLKVQNYIQDDDKNQNESLDNSQDKSFSSNSRSTISDKFNKLQKLERKNIIEDHPNFTMTKENLNFILKQTQQSNDDNIDSQSADQIIDVEQQIKLNDRRQSDSAVLIRNSQIQSQQQQQQQTSKNIINYEPQSQQHSTQKVNKRSYDYTQKSQKINANEIEELKETFTDQMITNIKSDNFTQDQFNKKQKPLKQQKQVINDDVTSSTKDSKLLEEYKQLKLLMKQMEKNPKNQNSQQKQGRSKNNNLLVSKSTQQQQLQSNDKNKLMLHGMTSRDQSQIKDSAQNKMGTSNNQNRSRKNLMSQQTIKDQPQQQQFNNNIGSYLSEGGMEDHELSYYRKGGQQINKIGGLLSVQQSTKAKDQIGKQLFKAEEQTSRTVNRRQQQKVSNRQSPHTRDKSQNQNRQQSKHRKQNIKNFKHVDDDEEESNSDDNSQVRNNRGQSNQSSPDNYTNQNQTYIRKSQHHNHHKNEQSIRHHKSTHKNKQQYDSNEQHYKSRIEKKTTKQGGQYLNIDKSRLTVKSRHQRQPYEIDSDDYNSHQSYEDENYSPSRRRESKCEYDEDQQDSYDQEYSDEEDQRSHSDSDYSSQNSQRRHKHDQEDSEYDSQQENSEDDSQQYSDSYDSESNSCPDLNNKSKRHKKHKKESKVRKITKTVKQGDRKFKININMHGEKPEKKGKNKQANDHEILLFKQRQILQQQQMMLQMAQYPQQQLLLQQQLALQQQLLLQQQQTAVIPQQNTFINPTNIQSTVNLGGMQSPQNNLDISSPTTFQNASNIQSKNQQNPNYNAHNMSVFSNNKQSGIEDQRFKASQLKREGSTNSLNNITRQERFNQNNVSQLQQQNQFRQQQTAREKAQNISPNRDYSNNDYNRSSQYNQNQDYRAMYVQKNLSNARSPHREEDLSNRSFMGGIKSSGAQQEEFRFQNQQHLDQQQQNNNYLNQIKNRLRTGGADNQRHNQEQEDFDNFIGNQNQLQVDSRNRNQRILQNNSSPVQNQSNFSRDEDKSFRNQDYLNDRSTKGQYQQRQRGGIQEYKPKQSNDKLNYTRFEDAKDYAKNKLQQNDDDFEDNLGSARGGGFNQRHARTSSYVPPHDNARQGSDDYTYMQKSTFGNNQKERTYNIENKDYKQTFKPKHDFTDENSGNVTPMQQYENENEEFNDVFHYQPPNFSKHNTGDFPQRSQQDHSKIDTKLRGQNTNIGNEHDDLVSKWSPKKSYNQYQDEENYNRERSRSANDRDQSMDEGVSVANLRQSKQLSPKAEFNFEKQGQYNQKSSKFNKQDKIDSVKTQNRPSLNKQQSMKTESNNQKAQMIIIGFDDDEKQGVQADIFKNKPKLKEREKGQLQQQQQDLAQRSKSTKPMTQNLNQNKKSSDAVQNQPQQRRVPFQRQKLQQQQQQDMQPAKGKIGVSTEFSPPTSQSINIKYEGNITPNMKQNELIQLKNLNQSPLKKAVKDIQQKDNIKNNIAKRGGEMIQIDFQQDEDLDPKHNQDLAIEILDKKKNGAKQQQEKSLADMFLAKKREALQSRQDAKTTAKSMIDQDSHVQSHNQENSQDRPVTVGGKQQEKSKKELAELRKQMMKNRVKSTRDNFSQNSQGSTTSNPNGLIDPNAENKNKKAAANEELMLRLALGKKVQVDKKEMKKLTSKNFQNLPEIKKKKEEEQKRQMQAERKAAAAQYMKEFAEKRRQQILKKKKSGSNIIDGDQ